MRMAITPIMKFAYLITPFLAWLIAGSLKFLVNSYRAKKLAVGLIGYGGMPSNHSAIVSSMTALIAFQEGFSSSFGAALTLAFIVILDASSLRRQIGKHAEKINQVITNEKPLRERMGHTPFEILAGILVGIMIGFIVHQTII